jgi:hypothetical protein
MGYNKDKIRKGKVKKMSRNKWFAEGLGCLMIGVISGALEKMSGVLICIVCAGVCFAKWIVEEDDMKNI